MTISGNISSAIYDPRRAGLPANRMNVQTGELVTDDEVWPCGLVLGKNEAGKYLPYDTVETVVGTGDASLKAFTDEVGAVEPGSASVAAGAITLTDDGCGNFTGTGGSGSINYETGAISLAYTDAPALAADVTLSHKPDPQAVLDADTDTKKSTSALVVRFGAVKKAELKVGVTAQAVPAATVIRRLDIHSIYAV